MGSSHSDRWVFWSQWMYSDVSSDLMYALENTQIIQLPAPLPFLLLPVFCIFRWWVRTYKEFSFLGRVWSAWFIKHTNLRKINQTDNKSLNASNLAWIQLSSLEAPISWAALQGWQRWVQEHVVWLAHTVPTGGLTHRRNTVLFQPESLWMSFLKSPFLGGIWLRGSSADCSHTRQQECHEGSGSGVEFESLWSSGKGTSYAQNFLSFMMESSAVCPVQSQGCDVLDRGPRGTSSESRAASTSTRRPQGGLACVHGSCYLCKNNYAAFECI